MKKVAALIVVALILGGSFIIVANIVSDTAISIKNKGYVSVKGFSKQEITSDLGLLDVTIISENKDLRACYVQLSSDKGKIMDFLRDVHGVKDDEIELRPASISENYKINDRGYSTDEFNKYILRQEIKIESEEVKKIAEVSSGLIDILYEGVKVSIGEPEYIYQKLDDLKVEMIGRATNNARERAIKIAKEGKFKLGPIANVRVGIFQITPANSTAISNYGMNDTSTIDKEIKSVVEIKYFVK